MEVQGKFKNSTNNLSDVFNLIISGNNNKSIGHGWTSLGAKIGHKSRKMRMKPWFYVFLWALNMNSKSEACLNYL